MVSAPLFIEEKYINDFIVKQKDWIDKKMQQYKKEEILKEQKIKKRMEENKIIFMGYELTILKEQSNKNDFYLNEYYLILYMRDINNKILEDKLIYNFYKSKAKEIVHNIHQEYCEFFPKSLRRVSIKKMRTRWGSCNSAKGYINLNIFLLEKPYLLIKYVIIHELAHLMHANHGMGFYNLLSAALPSWKEHKKTLDKGE